MQYKLINNTRQKPYDIIMDIGDDIKEKGIAFAKKEKMKTYQFTAIAIGAVIETVTDFFDFSVMCDQKTTFEELREMLALISDFSMDEDNKKIHAHVVLGRKGATAHFTHLMKGMEHPALQKILNKSPQYLKSEMNQ